MNNRLKGIQAQDSRPEQDIRDGRAPLLRILTTVSRTAVKFSLFNRLARTVDRNLAGADIPLKSEEYIVLTAGISLLAGVLSALALASVYHGAAVAALGVLFSVLWIRMAKARRLNKFNFLIGDSLVIMSNALRSGFSFLQAMDMVRKEMPDPIAREFGRTFQEMSLGTPTEEALENLNKRVGSEDLELVITAVLIQRQVGGNLAEILDNIANTIRERVRIQGEIKTLTAQGRISGIIIGVLPLLLAATLSLISPQYLEPLVTHPLGQGMLVTALALELLGILIIRKIINIKV
ncbi:MAG: type II secretion system F family protein [Bacillota bacterium]